MHRSGTLPPLTAASARQTGAMPQQQQQSAAADAALAFDFEMRATVSGGNGSTGGAGGGAASGSTKVSGTRIVARQLAASASASALHNSSSQADPTKLRASSAFGPLPQSSLQPLPSHCVTTSQKLDYFLSWGKSAPRSADSAAEGKEDGPSGIGQVVGVLTPRTRYERLAQSVAAVPFVDRSAAMEQEAKQESRAQRSLGSSASSPALLHASFSSSSFGRATPTLSASPSHSSLSHPSRSASSASLHYGGDSSGYVRPSVFLDTFMPSNHLALSTHEENLRARALEAKFTLLRDQRKLRKKLSAMASSSAGKDKSAAAAKKKSKQPEHRPKSSVSGMRSSIGGPAGFGFDASSELTPAGDGSSDDGGESSDDGDLMDDDHNPLLGLPKRKPGLQAGQALLHQIQAVIRAVADEKAEALVATHAAHAKGQDKNKKNKAAEAAAAAAANADNSSDEDDSTAVVVSRSNNIASSANKPLSSEEKKAASKADAATMQSVIQAYLESSGLAGSVAAGGSSTSAANASTALIPGAPTGGVTSAGGGGGNGSVKDRDGTSTFTTAKITRDVTLVLNYLKSNPIMRGELEDKIRERQAQKRAKLRAAAKEAGRDPSSVNKVYTNKTQAWSLTEEVREAARREVSRAEQDRFARAQERKAGIDAFWQRKAAERDANVMLRYGPEMEARRRRENAENERLGRVQWGWLMFAALIPLTLKLKWKAKEIVTQRLQKQVHAFLVPLLKRHYVLNITSKLNENRALALAKIKRVLVRYVTRWKFMKRRSALLNLWKFLTLVKNAHAIRVGLKDSSLRSQIIKIQTWWRGIARGVIGGQIDLVEIKWTKRETGLISAHTKRKKKEAWLAARKEMQTKPGKKPAPAALQPKHARGSSSAAAALAATPGDYSHTLSTFNFAGGLDALALDTATGGDGSGMVAPKRIPRAQKRDMIARYVRRKRADWRARVRAFHRELEQWHREHKHEIELHKARRELGLQKSLSGGASSHSKLSSGSNGGGSGGVSDLVLVPPTRPVLRILPPMHELDSMIMQASKSYVLGKLRGATMGPTAAAAASVAAAVQQHGDDASSAASSFRGGSIGSSEKTTRRLTGGSSSSAASGSSADSSGSRNPMLSFTPGSSHQPMLHLKAPPTVGDRERAKRELLATSLIPEQTIEENDAQVDDE